jgi:dual-action HEIGH metallo-peptidase
MRSPFFGPIPASAALLAVALSAAQASGPLAYTTDGRPYRLDATQPVRLVVDAGPLASRAHAQAVAMVDRACRTWEAVPTGRLKLERVGELSQDIDGHNVMEFLSQLKEGDPCPILFDNDGSILTTLFGGTIGSGVHVRWWAQPDSAQYTLSVLIIHGPSLSAYSDDYITQVIAHELGHLVGLDHSQLNQGVIRDGDPTDDALAPVMSYSWGPNSQVHLHPEDEAWLSWLYPTPEFADGTGSIRGRVLLPDRKTGLMGVMVVARSVDRPMVTAVSAVSGDRFFRADAFSLDAGRPGDVRGSGVLSSGVYDLDRLGELFIPGLPPGSYTLELQQLEAEPIVKRTGYLIGGPKFWRQDSSAQDPPGASTPVVVNAGQETTGIDIVVNGQDLGEPQSVAELEPNPWHQPQTVRLPAVIEGAVEGDAGPVSQAAQRPEQYDDVYRVRLQEWTTVTAVLSAAQPAADLDLYLVELYTGDYGVAAQAIGPGTPPEILQERLSPGDYLFAVHHAGGPASAYTLRLLGTPAPDPARATELVDIDYLYISDVTETSAVVHWRLTSTAPALFSCGQPLHEEAVPTARDHTNPLTGLPAGGRYPVRVAVGALADQHRLGTTITTAKPAALNGTPQVVVNGSVGSITGKYVGRDIAKALVHIRNLGDGEALNVRLESVEPAPGWELMSQTLYGTGLPPTVEVGRMGVGTDAPFGISLVRVYGPFDPEITVHGSYTDAAGTVRKF